MFARIQPPGRRGLNVSLIGSAMLHGVALWLLCLHGAPIFVKARLIAHGNNGYSSVLYYTPPGPQQTLVAERTRHVAARLYLPVKKKTSFNAKITNQKDAEAQNIAPSTEVAGAATSSDQFGDTTGADVRPAIELSLIDPPISKTEIPTGVEGDVVVEISIDEHGYVVATKLLKGLGYGIDEKCMATIQRYWHYRPATRDGVPIPSKYDARWHYRSNG